MYKIQIIPLIATINIACYLLNTEVMQLADIRNKPLCYTALFASALATAMTRVIVFWDSQSVRLSVRTVRAGQYRLGEKCIMKKCFIFCLFNS